MLHVTHTMSCLLPVQAPAQLLGVLLPLLKLLTHDAIRTDPSQANPVLSTLHDSLSLQAMNTALESLSGDPAATEDGFIRRKCSSQQRGMVSTAQHGTPQLEQSTLTAACRKKVVCRCGLWQYPGTFVFNLKSA
jgi:hypothetical protein